MDVNYADEMFSSIMVRPSYRQYRKLTELWLIPVAVCSVIMGYFIGSSFRSISPNQVQMHGPRLNAEANQYMKKSYSALCKHYNSSLKFSNPSQHIISSNNTKIYVATNPRGAESLPPGIVEPYSDLYLRRVQGNPSEDLVVKPKYLLALTVGYLQKDIINRIVTKFSENFTIVLFHYDGRTSEWEGFEWSQRAIHISARKQTKWWYAKRFLHPDIVAQYEYIFIWDEDLGVEQFNAEEYIKLVKKHGLEISQPAIESKKGSTWLMTKRRVDVEVHKEAKSKHGWCHNSYGPPCAGFVEIMAPVFSRKSWRCVWHMIQNDLVHGWGLDLALWRCVERPRENIGVVDAQWIEHKALPSLGNQGQSTNGGAPWRGVRARCKAEWKEFTRRMKKAEEGYLQPR